MGKMRQKLVEAAALNQLLVEPYPAFFIPLQSAGYHSKIVQYRG
jgi:hypothetical protein